MHAYDVIMLFILVACVVWGLWKGLAWQIASFASFTLSYIVSYQFRDQLAAYINTEAPWNMFLAMLILYVGTSLAIWIVFRFVSGVIEKVKLQEFDAQLGGMLGLIKGVVVCSVITLFAVALLPADWKKEIVSSHSGYYLAVGLDKLEMIMPKEWHDVVHPYVHPFGGEDHEHTQTEGLSKQVPVPTPGVASPIGGGTPIGSGQPEGGFGGRPAAGNPLR